MNDCKLIKKSTTIRISIEYKCPNKGTKHSVKLINPKIETKTFYLYDDYNEEYEYVTFLCKQCGKEHTFRI